MLKLHVYWFLLIPCSLWYCVCSVLRLWLLSSWKCPSLEKVAHPYLKSLISIKRLDRESNVSDEQLLFLRLSSYSGKTNNNKLENKCREMLQELQVSIFKAEAVNRKKPVLFRDRFCLFFRVGFHRLTLVSSTKVHSSSIRLLNWVC